MAPLHNYIYVFYLFSDAPATKDTPDRTAKVSTFHANPVHVWMAANVGKRINTAMSANALLVSQTHLVTIILQLTATERSFFFDCFQPHSVLTKPMFCRPHSILLDTFCLLPDGLMYSDSSRTFAETPLIILVVLNIASEMDKVRIGKNINILIWFHSNSA